MIYAIAAIDSKLGLATDTGIPWNLPTDQRYFRDMTKGGTVMTGYRAYLEYEQPLPDRRNLVIVRPGTEALRPGFEAVLEADLPGLLDQFARSQETLWIIGGAKVYAKLLDQTQRLYLTRVEGDFHCTKFFPAFESQFELSTQSEPQTENGLSFHFEIWQAKLSA